MLPLDHDLLPSVEDLSRHRRNQLAKYVSALEVLTNCGAKISATASTVTINPRIFISRSSYFSPLGWFWVWGPKEARKPNGEKSPPDSDIYPKSITIVRLHLRSQKAMQLAAVDFGGSRLTPEANVTTNPASAFILDCSVR